MNSPVFTLRKKHSEKGRVHSEKGRIATRNPNAGAGLRLLKTGVKTLKTPAPPAPVDKMRRARAKTHTEKCPHGLRPRGLMGPARRRRRRIRHVAAVRQAGKARPGERRVSAAIRRRDKAAGSAGGGPQHVEYRQNCLSGLPSQRPVGLQPRGCVRIARARPFCIPLD